MENIWRNISSLVSPEFELVFSLRHLVIWPFSHSVAAVSFPSACCAVWKVLSKALMACCTDREDEEVKEDRVMEGTSVIINLSAWLSHLLCQKALMNYYILTKHTLEIKTCNDYFPPDLYKLTKRNIILLPLGQTDIYFFIFFITSWLDTNSCFYEIWRQTWSSSKNNLYIACQTCLTGNTGSQCQLMISYSLESWNTF